MQANSVSTKACIGKKKKKKIKAKQVLQWVKALSKG
jgi:hypothetical protein